MVLGLSTFAIRMAEIKRAPGEDGLLGWRILKHGEYRLDLPRLSDSEEAAVAAVAEKFREAARTESMHTKDSARALMKRLLLEYATEKKIYLETDQAEYLGKIAYMHIYGFAFVEQLLNDNEIEEISIIGIDKPAYIYLRNKGWKSVNACFTEQQAIADVANKMARGIGRHITAQNPRINAMLPDGSRLHASLPPISHGELTIRKFRERPFSPKELCTNNTICMEALAYLSLLMQSDRSVIIAGNTASGKTTTLNALFSFVPCNERIVITEETPEINIPHLHQMRLVANQEMGVSLKELVYDSLRMRPDRMIVGEIRNAEEAEALFDVLLAGQARGSYATLHAQSAGEAVQRLLSFGINRMDINSIDCIVVQRRMLVYDRKKRKNTEVRRVTEIVEVGEKMTPVFSYNREKDVLERDRESVVIPEIAKTFGSTMKDLEGESKERQKLFSKLGSDLQEFYAGVQKNLYGLRTEYETD
jgi:Flp pilus assembly CpaF family ATPase